MAAAIGIAKTATEIFLGVGEISIDNLTFKLFYKWSVTLFIVSSVLVCTSQFFGEPIQCETVSARADGQLRPLGGMLVGGKVLLKNLFFGCIPDHVSYKKTFPNDTSSTRLF